MNKEFRRIPGFESHAVNRSGIVIRVADADSKHSCYSKGYTLRGHRNHGVEFVSLTQNGRSLRTSRRVLVQRAFGSSWAAGTQGEKNGQHKLTEAEVIEIRERYANGSGETLKSIARDFNCGENNVREIIKGRSWRHLLKGFTYASNHKNVTASAVA